MTIAKTLFLFRLHLLLVRNLPNVGALLLDFDRLDGRTRNGVGLAWLNLTTCHVAVDQALPHVQAVTAVVLLHSVDIYATEAVLRR